MLHQFDLNIVSGRQCLGELMLLSREIKTGDARAA